MVGLMETSSKRSFAIAKSAALSLWQTTVALYLHRRHTTTVLSQSLWGPYSLCAQGFCEPLECLLSGKKSSSEISAKR